MDKSADFVRNISVLAVSYGYFWHGTWPDKAIQANHSRKQFGYLSTLFACVLVSILCNADSHNISAPPETVPT